MIVVTGGRGEFATQIKKHAKVILYSPSSGVLDIREFFAVREYFQDHDFDYVIHAAAIARPMVRHEESPQSSIETNIIGTANVAMACKMFNKKLIYISTDYVYEGTEGNYNEEDPVKPFINYGWSKLGGECAVQMIPGSLILRMAMCSRDFTHEKAIFDSNKSCIYIDDAARITLQLLDEEGVINIGGPTNTLYNFYREDIPDLDFMSREDVKGTEIPKDCSMDTTKLESILND
jgi:dTDP-4-dehydrorhamnose reductase